MQLIKSHPAIHKNWPARTFIIECAGECVTDTCLSERVMSQQSSIMAPLAPSKQKHVARRAMHHLENVPDIQ